MQRIRRLTDILGHGCVSLHTTIGMYIGAGYHFAASGMKPSKFVVADVGLRHATLGGGLLSELDFVNHNVTFVRHAAQAMQFESFDAAVCAIQGLRLFHAENDEPLRGWYVPMLIPQLDREEVVDGAYGFVFGDPVDDAESDETFSTPLPLEVFDRLFDTYGYASLPLEVERDEAGETGGVG